MKPRIHIFLRPRLYRFGGEPVAIVGATVRLAPDEGLLLWGYRPHNCGVYAFRIVGWHRVTTSEVWGWWYRPAYREARRVFEAPHLAFAAGATLATVAGAWTWPVCACCND